MAVDSPTAVACIVGWHFPETFFCKAEFPPHVIPYLVSHRNAEDIPQYVTRLVPRERQFCTPNIGYDWGAFQQFLELVDVSESQVVFFMHDDIEVLDPAAFDVCIDELNNRCAIIGNSDSGIENWAEVITPSFYAHLDPVPPKTEVAYPVVRGSFFGIRTEVLQQLGEIPVFWDRYGISINHGNNSLHGFCQRVSALVGHDQFRYLSNVWDEPFIRELKRGCDSITQYEAQQKKRNSLSRIRERLVQGLVRRTLETYVRATWRGRRWLAALLRPIVRHLSARPSHLVPDKPHHSPRVHTHQRSGTT